MKPINVDRNKLVKVLKTELKRKEQARDDLEAARKEKEEKRDALLREYIDLGQGRLLLDALTAECGWYDNMSSLEQDVLTIKENQAKVKQQTPRPLSVDPGLEKLIRVLEITEDTTVEVAPDDDAYKYL